jgi:hypothetical protein
MIDWLEQFFNWTTDQRWSWYPFPTLKPEPLEPISGRRWLKMVTAFGGLATICWYLAFCFAKMISGQLSFFAAHPALLVTYMPSVLFYYGRNYGMWFVIGCPIAYIVMWSPWVFFWNRRARRLVKQTANMPPGNPDQWPPAPSRG